MKCKDFKHFARVSPRYIARVQNNQILLGDILHNIIQTFQAADSLKLIKGHERRRRLFGSENATNLLSRLFILPVSVFISKKWIHHKHV